MKYNIYAIAIATGMLSLFVGVAAVCALFAIAGAR